MLGKYLGPLSKSPEGDSHTKKHSQHFAVVRCRSPPPSRADQVPDIHLSSCPERCFINSVKRRKSSF